MLERGPLRSRIDMKNNLSSASRGIFLAITLIFRLADRKYREDRGKLVDSNTKRITGQRFTLRARWMQIGRTTCVRFIWIFLCQQDGDLFLRFQNVASFSRDGPLLSINAGVRSIRDYRRSLNDTRVGLDRIIRVSD